MSEHTIPGLLHGRVALPNSYPYACVPNREVVCTVFMMFFGSTFDSGVLPLFLTRHLRYVLKNITRYEFTSNFDCSVLFMSV